MRKRDALPQPPAVKKKSSRSRYPTEREGAARLLPDRPSHGQLPPHPQAPLLRPLKHRDRDGPRRRLPRRLHRRIAPGARLSKNPAQICHPHDQRRHGEP